MLTLHKDSHLDHGLTQPQIDYLFSRFSEHSGFFIETFELPEELGTVPCGLYGPVMGDAPVTDGHDTRHVRRGNREYTSRVVDRPMRQTRMVTIIAGPHDGHDCVLYTAFGGPATPQEPNDPSCKDLIKSVAFWREHALAF